MKIFFEFFIVICIIKYPHQQISTQTIIMSVVFDKLQRIFIFQGIGTILFAYGIGCAGLSSGEDIVLPPDGVLVSCSLLAGLALCAQITDGHLNPLLAIASHTKKPSRYTWIQILGQFIGGFLGVILFWIVTGKAMIPVVDDPLNGEGVEGFKQILKYSLNELIGAFFFGLFVLMVTNHLTSYATKSWQKYLLIVTSLFLVRKMTGETALNPGIAVPAQLFASLIDPDHANPLKSLIVLIPSLFGGFFAGLIMKKLYEPLLLYSNFKTDIEEGEPQEEKQN